MQNIIPVIFEIWDTFESNFTDFAKKTNRRYTSRDYARYDKTKVQSITLVSQKEMHYVVPRGLIYPIVGAFRALIDVKPENGVYRWKKDPKKIIEKLGSKLVGIVLDEKTDSPEYIGKSTNLWNNLFKEVYIEGHLL